LLNKPDAETGSSFLREAEQKALAALGIALTPSTGSEAEWS
jgi:hypothetical protein